MKNGLDVVVVGGGPCGSFAAYNLAKLGADVTVLEEHKEVGIPSHCAGHFSIKGLRGLGQYPLPKDIVENTFWGATFHAPTGQEFSIRFHAAITCVVNRALFDKHVAELAEDTGVEYRFGSRAHSLTMKGSVVTGVTAGRLGVIENLQAKLVIDAEGASCRLLRQAGLTTARQATANAVLAEVENVENAKTDTVEVFLGRDYAPGFYAWLIPQSADRAKIGLAANSGNLKQLLQKFMLKHPTASDMLSRAKILRTSFHPIILGGPIPESYGDGFLAVGDAASQVKPTTGGGVIWGMTCARVAAQVAWQALCEGDSSSRSLRRYQSRCNEALDFDVYIMRKLRRFLAEASDRTMNDAIEFCSKINLDKTLQNIDDVDFQGQSLLHVLASPRMMVALGYFLFLYLSANP